METATYQCPMCGNKMERDLVLFLDHANQHIIDKIKESHPEWVAQDGICKPCANFYALQLSGKLDSINIGPLERRKRLKLGIAMLAVSTAIILIFVLSASPRIWRFILFFPIFLSLLCFIENRESTCVVLAEQGVRDLDLGRWKIDDDAIAAGIKNRARKILLKSAVFAALATAFLALFP